jgi:hypothetical protein
LGDRVVDDMFSAASLMELVHVDAPLSESEELGEVLEPERCHRRGGLTGRYEVGRP